MTAPCDACPPLTPCPPADVRGQWSETHHSFAIGFGFAAQGTESGSAAPGLMDVLYHVDHLLGSASLPFPSRSEEVEYEFALSAMSGFDADEFQIRGRIAARLDWTLPPPTVAASQVRQNARTSFKVLDNGSPILGLDLFHDRTVGTTAGTSWDTLDEDITARVYFSGGSHVIATFPLEQGNFVLDRSVNRGTTQLWFDGNLLADLVTTIPRDGGPITAIVDDANVRVFTISVPDLTMAEMESELSGLRICPPGTAIPELAPKRGQVVHHEFVGIGDGTTTAFATDFPYLGGSLEIEVAGIVSESDSTDPAGRLFTLTDPPPLDAWITAAYRAAGG